MRTWQRSLHGAVVALLSDLVVRVAQLYPCCASGARQRPRTVRLTHGCANSAPHARPLTRQCQLGTSISDRVNFTPQALQEGTVRIHTHIAFLGQNHMMVIFVLLPF